MKIIVFPLLCIFFISCSQRELPQQNTTIEPLSLDVVSVPAVVNPGGAYLISAHVVGGAGVDSVQLDVLTAENALLLKTFWLYDDGGANHTEDGDQVAFDNVFSQRIVWAVDVGDAQKLTWRFQATDVAGAISEPVDHTVSARENSAPVLLKVETPDSLPSGFEGQLSFRVEAADSNGVDDIDKVMYSAFHNGVLNFEQILEPGETAGVYVQNVERTFAAGKKGAYTLKFKAIDKSGTESAVVERVVNIGNNAPTLLDFVHADSVQQPQEGKIVAFLISVRVEDEQSLVDVKDVKLEWKKPDSTYSQNSPFDLYDNGLPWNQDFQGWDDGWRGDENAGDGIYSITGIFDPNQPIGDYELTFYAADFAGNQSERITRIVTFYPREGL